jgi:hypothetical protein
MLLEAAAVAPFLQMKMGQERSNDRILVELVKVCCIELRFWHPGPLKAYVEERQCSIKVCHTNNAKVLLVRRPIRLNATLFYCCPFRLRCLVGSRIISASEAHTGSFCEGDVPEKSAHSTAAGHESAERESFTRMSPAGCCRSM